MMEGRRHSYDRDSMMEMLKRNNVPYVDVHIHLDGVQRENSPIGHIADSFEMLVNSLLGDIVMTASSDAGHLLSYYTQLLDNLCSLSGLIMNEEGRVERLKETMDKMIKDHGKHKEGGKEEEEGRKTEVPQIFLNAFKEEKEEEGRREAKEAIVNNFTNEEEEGKEGGKEEEEGGSTEEGEEEVEGSKGGSVEGEEEGREEAGEGKEGKGE